LIGRLLLIVLGAASMALRLARMKAWLAAGNDRFLRVPDRVILQTVSHGAVYASALAIFAQQSSRALIAVA
jgi:hypothetical protein